jgi:dihydrofolate reductase
MPVPLIYVITSSLDGYIAGPDGRFDWATPDAEVHTFFNDLARPVRTEIYGRKMYEVMSWWEDVDLDELPDAEREWAVEWRNRDKIVYSTTLESVSTARTELRREFDVAEIRAMKDASDSPISISGGDLASVAAREGLLDEVHVVLATAVVGGGTRWLDEGVRLDLQLFDEKRFTNGFVYLAYRVLPLTG